MVNYELQIVNYELSITNCKGSIVNYQSLITYHSLIIQLDCSAPLYSARNDAEMLVMLSLSKHAVYGLHPSMNSG